MKALVMGGNRFFGKRLVSALLAEGADVTLLNRGQRADEFGSRVERIVMDRKRLDREHPALAQGRWDIIYDQICYDAVEAEEALRVFHGKTRRYVFVSSQSVYGEGRGIPESAFDPYAYKFALPIGREQSYAEAKRQAEAVFFQKADFPVTAVRFPIVLGEDDYTERLKLHVKLVHEQKPLFFPDTAAEISFLHSSDAAAFLRFLASHEITGPINCCAPEPISLRALLHEIERAVGKDALITSQEGQGEPSPFGIASDWFMDARKAIAAGFTPRLIKEWLPGLVEALFRQVSSG